VLLVVVTHSQDVGQPRPREHRWRPPPFPRELALLFCHGARKSCCVLVKRPVNVRIPSERRGLRSCETVIRGWGVTTLWWLEFLGGRAVIIEGESLAHARLLATVNGFGRASQFIDGYAIDAHLMELIPGDYIGWTLSRATPTTCFGSSGLADGRHKTPSCRKRPQVRRQLNPAGRGTASAPKLARFKKRKRRRDHPRQRRAGLSWRSAFGSGAGQPLREWSQAARRYRP
jgi:hypothetical protein